MPRHALVGALMLVVGAILLAAFGRGLDAGPPAPPVAVVAAYDVRFVDRPDGSLDAFLADGRPLGTLSVAESGFTRGVMRGFARGRKQAGIAADAPLRLTRLADGRFLMEDPGQTMRIELDVFGSANAAILARLWRAGHALDARAAG
jgi:putative photosynthetic complex assembly protein